MAGRIVCLTLIFIIAAAADPSTPRAQTTGIGMQSNPAVLDIGRNWLQQADQARESRRQREEALATIRALVQMYPGAFGPDFLNGLTPEAAPGLLPIVQAHALEYLRTHR